MMRVLIGTLTLLGALMMQQAQAQAQPERPYSCRLLDDEERKCTFDPHCDRRVIERLVKECRRDGGRP
jgi:hypothetical protein